MWGQLSGSCTLKIETHGVPGIKVNISGFNSRADAESKKVIYTWVQFATDQEL